MAEHVIDNPAEQIADPVGMMCGYPKTGRTWMRYMLATAFVEEYDLGIDVDLTNIYAVVPNDVAGQAPGQPIFAYDGVVPRVEMSHLPYMPEIHGDKNVLFQTRDPRDVLVSHWMHNKNQLHQYEGTLTDFIHDRKYGIGAFVAHLESWAPHLAREDVITYEAMRPDPVSALKRVVDRFRLGVSESAIVKAVSEGAIDRMGAKEIERGIAGQQYNRQDRDARRVRRGKIGGFTDYMSADNLAFIHEAVAASSSQVQQVVALTGYERVAV